jgi:hypothetical protein
MYDKPFDAEACDIGGQASATNGLTDATNGGLSDVKNAPCNRPLTRFRARDGANLQMDALLCRAIVPSYGKLNTWKQRLGAFSGNTFLFIF